MSAVSPLVFTPTDHLLCVLSLCVFIQWLLGRLCSFHHVKSRSGLAHVPCCFLIVPCMHLLWMMFMSNVTVLIILFFQFRFYSPFLCLCTLVISHDKQLAFCSSHVSRSVKHDELLGGEEVNIYTQSAPADCV